MENNEFTIIQNDPNENVIQESKICVICNRVKLCVYIDCENICRECDKSINWLMYCHKCNNLFEKVNYKYCYSCNKITGDCCGALYFSKSIECICKFCYDYNCVICNKKTLSKEKQYIIDDDLYGKFSEVCDECKLIKNVKNK